MMMFPINTFYILVWRCIFYTLLLWSWAYLVRYRVPNKPVIIVDTVVRTSRKKLIALIVIFEIAIVQNGLWSMVLSGWGLLYGR